MHVSWHNENAKNDQYDERMQRNYEQKRRKGSLWRGTWMTKMGEALSPPSELNHKPKLWIGPVAWYRDSG